MWAQTSTNQGDEGEDIIQVTESPPGTSSSIYYNRAHNSIDKENKLDTCNRNNIEWECAKEWERLEYMRRNDLRHSLYPNVCRHCNDATNNLDERIGSAATQAVTSYTYNKNATIAGIKQ